ncbi:hypothetical protein LZ554_000852 [Drepanopeziza brunnea f. sp. 'monogermtubi']|nr:hypothetical protein LZ554_000852 [Drepanopeziza brunnea f. sp. 'monogermtubi']
MRLSRSLLTGLVIMVGSVTASADEVESCSASDREAITALGARTFGTSAGSSCGCHILNTLFAGKVLFPGSSAYKAEATHYWDLRANQAPKCVFVPTTVQDVAKGVFTLEVCQSQFAVRGAGHMPVPGAANTDGGVLIAMSAFRDLKISADLRTLEAGPALSWFDLYSYLEPYQKAVVGGRLKTIGVSGLTLGGGIHYFTARYGFAMDNVVAYQVVLASGRVVIASATQNTDLFWALKGGGNNFGIVTRFTFKTYDLPSVSTTIQMFGEEAVTPYIRAVADLANYQDQVDTGAGGIFTIMSSPANGVSIQFLGVQAGNTERPAVFANFTAIPSRFSTFGVTTLTNWSSTLDTPYQAARNMFGMRVCLADEATMQDMYTTFQAAMGAMAGIAGFSANLVFQPIPKSATTVAHTNGIGNPWALDNRKAYIFWLITTNWSDAADDRAVKTWSNELRERIHAANVQRGTGEPHIYMGDASDAQDPFGSLPPASQARLKHVRNLYDPRWVFTKQVTGGFKL